MKVFGCAACAALGSLSWGQALRPALTTTAIVGAKVEIRPGKVLEKGTVLMRDGLIIEVGEHVAVPAGAEVLDGKGLFVYAGFIDGGTSKGLKKPDSPRLLSNPDTSQDVVTQMRWGSPQVRPDESAAAMYQPDDETWKGYRSAGFTTIALMPGDGILRGKACLINASGTPRRDSVVANTIGISMRMAGSGSEYPGTELGAYSITRQTFMDAQWYRSVRAHYNAGQGKRPPDDPVLETLLTVLSGEVPAIFEADEQYQIDRVIDLANEFAAHPVIYGGLKAYKTVEKLKTFKTSVIAALNWPKEPTPEKEDPKKDDTKKPEVKAPSAPEAKPADSKGLDPRPPDVKAPAAPVESKVTNEEKKDDKKDEEEEPSAIKQERERVWLEAAGNVLTLTKAGVPVALSTRGAKDFDTFFNNLRRLVKLGLQRDEALAELTVNVAKVYGVDRQLGAIEAGKIANLTVLSADFLDAKAKAKYVYIDGRKFEIGKTPYTFTNAPQDFKEEK